MSPSFWAGLDIGSDLFAALKDSTLIELVEHKLRGPLRPRLWLDWGLQRNGGAHNSVIEAMVTRRGREMAELLVSEFGYERDKDLFELEDKVGGHDEVCLMLAVGCRCGGPAADGCAGCLDLEIRPCNENVLLKRRCGKVDIH
jgi:hypothetical protein